MLFNITMDYDFSISEDCYIHDIKSYYFDKLVKVQSEINSESNSSRSTESPDQFSFCPSVAFPLLETLDGKTKIIFDQMEELLSPLPCEINKRKLFLENTNLTPNSFTLIIEINGLLTSVKKENEVHWNHYSKEFLRQLGCHFEIILLSIYPKRITRKLINELDSKQYLSRVIESDSMIERDMHKLLDLRIFANRNPSQIIVLTSSLMSIARWLDNGIYLELDDKIKDKVMATKEFLLTLPRTEDVRPFIKKFSGLVRLFRIYKKETPRL